MWIRVPWGSLSNAAGRFAGVGRLMVETCDGRGKNRLVKVYGLAERSEPLANGPMRHAPPP